jgi:hypothetical protein
MYNYKTGTFCTTEFLNEQDKFDYFDYLTEVTYFNLNHSANKHLGIFFDSIDLNNKNHKFLLHIALRVVIFNDDIKVHIPNLNIFKFYKFIIKEFGFKAIKYFGRGRLYTIKPDELLGFQAKSNDVPVDMFGEIYTAYFEKGGIVYAL